MCICLDIENLLQVILNYVLDKRGSFLPSFAFMGTPYFFILHGQLLLLSISAAKMMGFVPFFKQ